VTAAEEWDGAAFTLTLRQSTPPTPGQPDKAPFVIPVAVGLLGPDGADLLPEGTRVLELAEAEQRFRFDGLPRPLAAARLLRPGAPDPRRDRRRARLPAGP